MTIPQKTFCLLAFFSLVRIFAQDNTVYIQNREIYTFPYPFSVFCTTSLLLYGTEDKASSGSVLLLPSSMEATIKEIPADKLKLVKSVRLIFYQSPASLPELKSIIQTMYPDTAAVIVCRYTKQAEVLIEAVSSRNSVFFRIIANLSAREPATRFSLINHYLFTGFSGKTDQILDSMTINFPDSYSTVDALPFWENLLSLLSATTFRSGKIYLLPLATLLIPVWEPVFYGLFMFFVLFNIAILLTSARAKIRYSLLYWFTTLSLCVTVWFSLVFSLYLALALFIIQPHFGRRIKIPVFLLLTLFWIGVLLHDFVLLVSGGLPRLQAAYCIFFLVHYLALAYASFTRRKAH